MVKKTISKIITQKINEYIKCLQADNIPIQKVIVFGSYAKGTQNRWSDIDVCVISPKFKDPFTTMQYLAKKTPFDMRHTIESIGFSPKDFADDSSLIHEIKKNGITIPIN